MGVFFTPAPCPCQLVVLVESAGSLEPEPGSPEPNPPSLAHESRSLNPLPRLSPARQGEQILGGGTTGVLDWARAHGTPSLISLLRS